MSVVEESVKKKMTNTVAPSMPVETANPRVCRIFAPAPFATPNGPTPRMNARLVMWFFQAEDGIRSSRVTGVQTCALPIHYAFFFQAEDGIRDYRGLSSDVCSSD